jgi:hypothetical protein
MGRQATWRCNRVGTWNRPFDWLGREPKIEYPTTRSLRSCALDDEIAAGCVAISRKFASRRIAVGGNGKVYVTDSGDNLLYVTSFTSLCER